MNAEQRFLAKVTTSSADECWHWGGASIDGYGVFRDEEGRTRRAHRWAYEHWIGPLPSGQDLVVAHSCHRGRQGCVNPAHLFISPRSANARDNGHARKTHCANGHEFTESNTSIRVRRDVDRRGRPRTRRTRVCRACAAKNVLFVRGSL